MGNRKTRPKPVSPFEMEREYRTLDASDENLEEQMNELAADGFQFKTTLNNGKKVIMEKAIPKSLSRKDSKIRETAARALDRGTPGTVDANAMDAAFDRAEKAHDIVKDVAPKTKK